MNPFDLTGPQFLLFYLIFAGVVLTGMEFWRRRAESSGSPRIDLSDPYLLAYLRGGKEAVLRVATAGLIDRDLLVMNGREVQRAQKVSPDSVRWPIEKALLKKYERPGQASWVFFDDGLSKECATYDRKLRTACLLPDQSVKYARLMRLLVGCFLLGGVALTKVVIALAAGRTNVGFLIILAVIAIAVAVWRSFPRLTENGKAVLEDAQSLYQGMRHHASSLRSGNAAASAGSADVEPLMMAAVFGAGALAAGTALSSVDLMFAEERKRQASSSCASGDGGCGSSCGSSCGGGGCGGCGGS